MILAAAVALALGVQSEPVQFKHGAWTGRCFREGYLAGRDHELCQAEIFVESGAQLERSAEGLTVIPFVGGECTGVDVRSSRLPAAAFTGHNRASRVAAFIRSKIEAALRTCRLKSVIPAIRTDDIAAFLNASDELRPGNFLLNAAARAPLAAKCGAQLELAWREEIKAHPIPVGSTVDLMMYTFSKNGPARAEKRFAKMPDIVEHYVAFGSGPGGDVMFAEKPAEAWRNAPSDWFVKVCDVAIDGWSGFVELALKQGEKPIFVVRAPTGAASEGFVITQQPLVQDPR